MSCGTPVLSFKLTALNDLIKNNINGFKVENFKNLRNKMEHLIKFDSQKRKKLIDSSVKYSKKFYFKKIEKKWINLII